MKRILILLMLGWITHASAIEMKNLYEADVLVKDQTTSSWKAALPAGYIKMLVKVTGNTQIGSVPVIAEDSQPIEPLVTGYRYYPLSEEQPSKDYAYRLHLQFSPNQIDLRLKTLGIAAWSANRPLTLVLFAYRSTGNPAPQILVHPSEAALGKTLKGYIAQRAVPAVFPNITESKQLVDWASKNWDESIHFAEQVGGQYQAKYVLLVRFYEASSGYKAEATWVPLEHAKQTALIRWKIAGSHPQDVLAQLVTNWADHLYEQETKEESALPEITITLNVQGREIITSYMDVQKKIESLSRVSQIKLLSLGDELVSFQVVMRGEIDTLRKELDQLPIFSAPASQDDESDDRERDEKTQTLTIEYVTSHATTHL